MTADRHPAADQTTLRHAQRQR